MDDKQLSYFISVADHLNFTKAAEHHYITQTAMSQQIMNLEQQLVVTLFNRSNRSVQLTNAGKVFYNEAKLILAKIREAEEKTRRAFSGVEGNLSIGFSGPYEKVLLPVLLRDFNKLYPDIHLSLAKKTMDIIREELEHGLFDIVIIPLFGLDLTKEIDYKTICKYSQCVVVYPDHPLANESKISRAALKDEPFITADRSKVPLAHDKMIQDCAGYGFHPNIIHYTQSLETALLMIEAGLGITLMNSSYKVYASENLRFIELEGEEDSVELVAAWKRDNPNPCIPLLFKVLDKA